MKTDVRIVLLGDEKTGKTSLITSLVSETFQEKVPPVIPEVTIPPTATPEAVSSHIVDTSPKRLVESDISSADVICIVYAVDEPETFNHIKSFWLPEVRRIRAGKPQIPVILVGNKIDVRGNDTASRTLEDDVMPIMSQFKEVETCVECSAKKLLNIQEVFYFAQKAVLYPTSPLYDVSQKKLEEGCIAALRRIFTLCDKDKDGALNDYELNEFQTKCFNGPLQPGEIDGVKAVVKLHTDEGVNEKGLLVVGFFFLHFLFIQKGRLETTWTVLRKFGYGDDLKLRPDFLVPPEYLQLAKKGVRVELSTIGKNFFVELFRRYDRDEDGALNQEEIDDLFSITPGLPWSNKYLRMAEVDKNENITLAGFLSLWSLLTLEDFQTTLKYLAYLGFEGKLPDSSPLNFIKPHSKKKGVKTEKNIFRCYVVGPPACGKTDLLRGLIGAGKNARVENKVVNEVKVGDATYYLSLNETRENDLSVLLTDNIESVDLLCILYDASNPTSVATFQKLYKFVYDLNVDIPCICVANKAERLSPAELKKTASEPRLKSLKTVDADIYKTLVEAACHPSSHYLHSGGSGWLSGTSLAVISVGVAAAAAAFYFLKYKPSLSETVATKTTTTVSRVTTPF